MTTNARIRVARPVQAVAFALLAAAAGAQAAEATWPVAGRQGMIRAVIVPLEQARDQAAYVRQIQRLCEGMETCFLNFYTNSSGMPVAMPLPEPIAAEATAVLRRSAKQGTEGLRWSCRLQLGDAGSCF